MRANPALKVRSCRGRWPGSVIHERCVAHACIPKSIPLWTSAAVSYCFLVLDHLWANWNAASETLKAAFVGGAATLIAASAGFGGLIWQMRSQANLSRQAILEAEARKLKAEMYSDGVQAATDLSDAAIAMNTILLRLSLDLKLIGQATKIGASAAIPSIRFPMIMDAHSKFSEAALKFIYLVENRRVIDPRIEIFRDGISSCMHEEQAFHSAAVEHFMPLVPTDKPNGGIYPYVTPNEEAIAAARTQLERGMMGLEDSISIAQDFLVELQNLLLGDLFEKEVAHRVPLDPRHRVFNVHDYDKLRAWLRTETEWSRHCEQIEAAFRSKLSHEFQNSGD